MPLTTPPKAVHDPFKSGWDDTLKSAESLKKQTSFKPKAKVSPLRIPAPTLKFPSPTNSTSSAEDESDALFAASTHDYLLSPTGKQALGRVGLTILSPKSQSAVDLDNHAESQQLIRKPPVSKIDTTKVDRHLQPPSQGFPATPETLTSFMPLPDPSSRPSPHDSRFADVRSQPPLEPPLDRVPRPRDNLSISAWPRPPTCIPLSPSPSPSRTTLTPSPTLSPSPSPTLKGSNRDSYNDYVRQPSPTFAKMTITNRDRAYIFGTPPPPSFTPPPPPRVSPPLPGQQSTPQVGVALKEVQPSKSPVLVSAEGRNTNSQVSWALVIDRNDDADGSELSPSVSSFVDSPSIYSMYSGDQSHQAGARHVA